MFYDAVELEKKQPQELGLCVWRTLLKMTLDHIETATYTTNTSYLDTKFGADFYLDEWSKTLVKIME